MTAMTLYTRFAKRITGAASAAVLGLATITQSVTLNAATAQDAVANNYVRITEESASRPRGIRLGLNKSIVVDLPAVANDVLVANPAVADAVMRTSKRIYLFGKEQGQTNIFVFDSTGKQIAAMEITVERDVVGLEASINRLIPNANVRAEIINGSVVLTGSVASPADAKKAVELATIFVTNENEQSGSFFFANNDTDIVNLIKIDGEDQVQLRVTIAEVSRAVVKQLGIQTQVDNPSLAQLGQPGADGLAFSALATGNPGLGANTGYGGTLGIAQGLNTIRAQLNALETAGVIRYLAEPNLTAVSGEAASFDVGGNWQVPSNVSQEDGSVAVTFTEKRYGIELDFTPTVLTEGRISLRLRTKVDEPVSPLGVGTIGTAGGIPGVQTREASTTVELPSGGSMAIAGLVQDSMRQQISGLPGLSKLPVLGSLFRSREFVRNETELVIIVTPYLVRPTARRNLVQPDAGFAPASDAAGMFMGRVNRVYGTKKGNLAKGRYTGSIGFILK
ncbi:MAG: type II and III secretion system protein family protein [Pseudomonadota bacterium]